MMQTRTAGPGPGPGAGQTPPLGLPRSKAARLELLFTIIRKDKTDSTYRDLLILQDAIRRVRWYKLTPRAVPILREQEALVREALRGARK